MAWENRYEKNIHLYLKLFSNICRASYFHSQKKKYADEIVSHLEQVRREKQRPTIDKKVIELSKKINIKSDNKIKNKATKEPNNKIKKLLLLEEQLFLLEGEYKRLLKIEINSKVLKKIDLKIKELKSKVKYLKNN